MLAFHVLVRKWNTAVTNTEAVALKYRRILASFMAKYNLSRLKYDTLLQGRPESAIPPVWPDLWFLYRKVRIRKPKVVLEFGSGCSTIILAQALRDNMDVCQVKGGHLFSIDASEYWAEVTRLSMPSHLRDICTILYSPLLEVEYHGVPGFKHAGVPDVVPNFLYLDGPALTPGRQVAVDVLDMEGKLPADFYMVVDGREIQCQFLAGHLRGQYRIKHNKILYSTVFEKA